MRLCVPAFAKICAFSVVGVTGAGMADVARAQYAGHVSSYAIDARTGEVLSAADPDLQRYPASLAKMMTLYMTFQALQHGNISLSQAIPVSIHAAMQAPSKLGLRPGSHFTVEQAVLALVTKSANDAACALGEFLGGGDEQHFAAMMTNRARAIGMSSTTFRNASGLPDPDQVTTARDMALLARHLIKDYPQYYHYFGTMNFSFHGHLVPTHDPMLKLYNGADGLKTGYTDLAGHNLVSSAQQGGTRIIGVVLGAKTNGSRNLAMISLLNEGFIAKGQTPLPLIKQAPAVPYRRTVPHSHMRHGVVLVSYRPHPAQTRMGHGHVVVRHLKVSRRGHHRS